MNIDKAKMKKAYLNRHEVAAQTELFGYFYEMANYFASKQRISNYYKEDYVQLAVARAHKKIDYFDENHINDDGNVSAVFSYFYKVIYNEIRYRMRETRLKKERRPNECSYDTISAMVEDGAAEESVIAVTQEEEQRHVVIDGKVYNRFEVIEAIRRARKFLNKLKKNPDFNPDTDDKIVLEFYHKLKGDYENKLEA
jgi:DNA-directed RNA polymerase specialized sigma24 family protein